MNIPLILTLPILPDIDLLLRPELIHGGPTHSIVLITIIFLPLFALWKGKTIPYFAALLSHPLVDYLTRTSTGQGIQLFFPITSDWFAAGSKAAMTTYIYIEMMLFVMFFVLMTATKDITTLMKPHPYNLLLAIPIATAFLPAFLQFPMEVPTVLIIPHLILIVLLTLSILTDLTYLVRHHCFNPTL